MRNLRIVVRIARVGAVLGLLVAAAAWATTIQAGGGCHREAAGPAVGTEAASSVVRIDGCTFLPTVNRVPVGTQVTFLNTSLTPHDVTGAEGAWASRILEPGRSYQRPFNAPGVFAYSCSLHPGMAGVIVATAGDDAPEAEPVSGRTPSTAGSISDGPDAGGVALGGVGLVLGAVASALLLRGRREAA